eukprot:366217-Chlamydomonas_euryale.AAC.3
MCGNQAGTKQRTMGGPMLWGCVLFPRPFPSPSSSDSLLTSTSQSRPSLPTLAACAAQNSLSTLPSPSLASRQRISGGTPSTSPSSFPRLPSAHLRGHPLHFTLLLPSPPRQRISGGTPSTSPSSFPRLPSAHLRGHPLPLHPPPSLASRQHISGGTPCTSPAPSLRARASQGAPPPLLPPLRLAISEGSPSPQIRPPLLASTSQDSPPSPPEPSLPPAHLRAPIPHLARRAARQPARQQAQRLPRARLGRVSRARLRRLARAHPRIRRRRCAGDVQQHHGDCIHKRRRSIRCGVRTISNPQRVDRGELVPSRQLLRHGVRCGFRAAPVRDQSVSATTNVATAKPRPAAADAAVLAAAGMIIAGVASADITSVAAAAAAGAAAHRRPLPCVHERCEAGAHRGSRGEQRRCRVCTRQAALSGRPAATAPAAAAAALDRRTTCACVGHKHAERDKVCGVVREAEQQLRAGQVRRDGERHARAEAAAQRSGQECGLQHRAREPVLGWGPGEVE